MFYKVSLVGHMILDLFARINSDFSKNIEKAGTVEYWDVVSYKLSEDSTFVEHFEIIGSGQVVADDHIAILLNNKNQINKEQLYLTSIEPELRRALVFVQKTYGLNTKVFIKAGMSKADLDRELRDEIINGGLIIFPEQTGFKALATSCSCKGFFGGTSGCSSANCTVIIGICQENTACKATDPWTSCACRAND